MKRAEGKEEWKEEEEVVRDESNDLRNYVLFFDMQ